MIRNALSEARDYAIAFLANRQAAYRATFNAPVAVDVLADLARFCRANKSTFHEDPNVAARLDGRREVFLRITEHLNLTQEQLWRLYSGTDK